jgi:hypothetical protein
MTTKIYQVKHGYTEVASFDSLEKATAFFSELVRGSGKTLMKVSGKGDEKKEAYYWGADSEFSMKIDEVDIYPSKKDAEFAVFE